MRKLSVFDSVSVDGFFVDRHGDMSWAKGEPDEEFDAFTSENAKHGGMLLFGRVTYELMAGFWPTTQARRAMPTVAERMNSLPKVVFSRTLKEASWNNTALIRGDLVTEARRLKQQPGPDMVILGSGSIVAQLARVPGLIDEYQLVVVPIVLGSGRTIFQGVESNVMLDLKASRTFDNGKIYLSYQPAV